MTLTNIETCPYCGTALTRSTLPNMDELHCMFFDCGWSGSVDEHKEE